jgi:tetraacyldisaccharide 4'-kinase
MDKLLKLLFLPLSFLYGAVVLLRNKLFDLKILHSKEFKLPILSVGNITVGGTGKTPHTEYLIRLLKDEYKIAFLSRGYKRKTADFRLAGENSTFEEIGDEPLQIKHKFPKITVAVDGNRVRGITKIQEQAPETDIVLLDDAFQHRWVLPGINILLIDYYRPIYDDFMLPSGRLREPVSGKKRADIIIVSKTPPKLSAIDKRLLLKKIDAQSHQSVYFTSIHYGMPIPVFPSAEPVFVPFDKPSLSVLLVTGIADPTALINEINSLYAVVEHLKYSDHYAYNDEDIEKMVAAFERMPGDEKIILTTEKDAARLINFEYQIQNREKWYYLPIEVEFHPGESELFNRQILHYVNNNSRNSLLYKKYN